MHGTFPKSRTWALGISQELPRRHSHGHRTGKQGHCISACEQKMMFDNVPVAVTIILTCFQIQVIFCMQIFANILVHRHVLDGMLRAGIQHFLQDRTYIERVHLRRLIRVVTVRLMTLCSLGYLQSPMWRLWSDCVDTQADLSHRWEHVQSCRKWCAPALLFLLRDIIYEGLRSECVRTADCRKRRQIIWKKKKGMTLIMIR